MRDRNGELGEADEELVRGKLHRLVDDVEPRPDALPRLLAATRRRRPVRSPVIKVAGAALAATVAVLTGLVVLPQQQSERPAPVSVQPNSYVTQRQAGVLASFDVASGRRLHDLTRFSGQSVEGVAADRDHLYAAVATRTGHRIVEIAPDGARHVVRGETQQQPIVLAAGGGRLAYTDRDAIVVEAGRGQHQRVPIPPGSAVRDLALASDGRLAVLTEARRARSQSTVPQRRGTQSVGSEAVASESPGELRVLPPGAPAMTTPPLKPGSSDCGPRAIAWSGRDLAALSPVRCGSPKARIQTLVPETGSEIGAGTPFDMGALPAHGDVRLSSDRLGRFLISVEDSRQWLVDGIGARPVPPACSSEGACAGTPATFWG